MSPADDVDRRAAREARARGGLSSVPDPVPDPVVDPAAAAGRAILAGQSAAPADPPPPARRTRRARRATSPDEFTAELIAHPPQVPHGVGTRPLNVQIPTDVLTDLGVYCARTGRARREVVHALLLQLLGPHDGTVAGQR